MKATSNMMIGLLASGVVVAGASEIPELLKMADGRPVTSVAAWEAQRRPEVLELFKTYMYGRNPVERPAGLRFDPLGEDTEMSDGKVVRKGVAIGYQGPGGTGRINVVAFIPKREQPVPVFVLISHRALEKRLDPGGVEQNPFWPVEKIVARGYAAVAFYVGDVDPDAFDGFTNGVHGVFQPDPKARMPDAWGSLAAWAWGASRVMDWIEQEKKLDAAHVAIVGHSRAGKTALWCGATDPRFALTISNESGCGGAKLNRMELPRSESIARITKTFPHWFGSTFARYGEDLAALPVDQHLLIALIAPRLAYVASASEDAWAGQPGEFQSCVLASPAWTLYGKKGLVGNTFPPVDTPLQDGNIGYHLRTGKHDLTVYDWERYMDFADRHWR